ncbi:MAG: PQQ-like beta-propeller repeat protein, partial [Verrucomicrobium sp.]|nr:PQQ-like beta-propeller repeat protein [Verrucomicrobium sp.]
MLRRFLPFALPALLAPAAAASDWPRFRGPDGTGISPETRWLGTWPGGQPRQVWKAEVGVGFSSMTVVQGRLFTMGHNGQKQDGIDSVVAIDATSGKELWRHSYPEKLADHYYEGGTSGTPTVDGDRVYSLSK